MYHRYQTGLRRVAAAVIDALLLSAPGTALTANGALTPNGQAILEQVNAFLPLLYSIVLHYRFGQTFGKKLVGIKVLDVSETRLPSWRQAVLRDSVWLGLEVLGLVLAVVDFVNLEWLAWGVVNASLLWVILEITTMLLSPKRRAIHDLLAGTVVVRE